jgi:hypothetical protein
MAKLSAHGTELLRLEYATHRAAYMSDGKVLSNSGSGWKLWRKCKDGVDPVQHAAEARLRREERDRACPQWAAYLALLCDVCTLEHRCTVHNAVETLAGDMDGAWAMLEDHRIECDLDDLVKLDSLLTTGRAELKAWKASRALVAA